ncbi:hypothetical protein [Nocardia amikacinitolerans]|uniref:hypothetical protein n=1 Tax=Nocardia amikacinitolerans TaxID=756689 RepID=UPI0020A41C0E|nr:hypothetical protein [Nocardia amikacinitolerans]MCP2290948.1 hypothetical protein [Nocardia amikacinitolerans]
MNEQDPIKDPVNWFFRASLLLLFGAVALTIAIDLLSQIWFPLLVSGLLVIAIGVGIAIWQARRRPW